MKMICTICARGGSKGILQKNIQLLRQKPLIVHTIEQAQKSQLFDCIAVSSDDDEVLSIAGNAGVEQLIKRPGELASDEAPKLQAIAHCVQEVEKRCGHAFDIIVDLDATSPLRSLDDIVRAVECLKSSKASNVITGCRARRSPYFNLVELDGDGNVQLSKSPQSSVSRRQDGPKCYDMNASIYVWWRDLFLKDPQVFYSDTKLYEMPEERSIDIDTPVDFKLVELLMP